MAWVIALGISAGYLISKNQQMHNRLEDAVTEFQDAAKPATDGPQSEEIRHVQATVPVADRFQDFNLQDLSKQQCQALVDQRQQAAQEVVSYENASGFLPPIEGVYLHFDNRGV
tara:strand:- start:261 stop:602 length:342 start_codon:yes stop_codon:yes gene_type:complete